MMKKIRNLFTSQKQGKSDFSSLFTDAPPEERRRVLEDAARKANQDQSDLVKQYEQSNPKAA